MRPAVIVGVLAVVATTSNLLLGWAPDAKFRELLQLGKWMDIEGRTTQYAYSFITGEDPDPSSTLFLLWNGLRLAAAAVLIYGVTTKQRRGLWLRAYQVQLGVSLLLWVVALAICLFWAAIASAVGLVVCAGTYCVLYYENPIEEEQRLAQDAELAAAKRRHDALQRQAREAHEREASATRAANGLMNVNMFLVTFQDFPPFFSIHSVTGPPPQAATGNPTSSSTASGVPLPLVRRLLASGEEDSSTPSSRGPPAPLTGDRRVPPTGDSFEPPAGDASMPPAGDDAPLFPMFEE